MGAVGRWVAGSLAVVVSASWATEASAQPVDGCADLEYQEDAQLWLHAYGPADPYGLDADGDGIACESLPLEYWPLHDAPAATSSAPGLVDVFVRGQDDALWWARDGGGGWTSWDGLGGILTSGPAAASPDLGQLDVFARGLDNAMWSRSYRDGTWSDWYSLGGILTSAPAATSSSPGTLDVVAVGTDRELYHRHFDGAAWSDWTSLGGFAASAPALVGFDGDLSVFTLGRYGVLWTTNRTRGTWSPWYYLEAMTMRSTPGAGAPAGGGDVLLSFRGSDNDPGNFLYDARSGWNIHGYAGGLLTSPPAVTNAGRGFELFVRGTDGALWTTRNGGGGWLPWTSVGGVMG